MADPISKLVATAAAEIGETRYACSITTGDHTLVADEPAPEGADPGPSPFRLLLSSLGACTAITLRMYAECKSWPLRAVRVHLAFRWVGEGAERASYRPLGQARWSTRRRTARALRRDRGEDAGDAGAQKRNRDPDDTPLGRGLLPATRAEAAHLDGLARDGEAEIAGATRNR